MFGSVFSALLSGAALHAHHSGHRSSPAPTKVARSPSGSTRVAFSQNVIRFFQVILDAKMYSTLIDSAVKRRPERTRLAAELAMADLGKEE